MKVDTAYNELCFCDINTWASGNTEAGQLDCLPSGSLLHLFLDKEKHHRLIFFRIL